jgi:hypothetical protein
MMVSIHGPDDSEFDFRTAMNIGGNLERDISWLKKQTNQQKNQNFRKKIVMKSLLLRKITRERRIKRDMLKIK